MKQQVKLPHGETDTGFRLSAQGARSMSGLPYYKAYPRDFIDGTVGMPFEEKCAYRVLLDLIYIQWGALPDDPRFISGQLGCSIRKWKSIRDALVARGKITITDGSIANKRADKELEMLSKLQDKQRENATRGNKNNDLQKPWHRQPEPEPEPVKSVGKPTLARSPLSPSRFNEFWSAYPHRGGAKKGRKPSEAKYATVIKSGADEQDIIDGAKRFALDRQAIAGFAPDPVTWLNQAKWTDEIDTGQEQQKGQRNGTTTGHGRLSAFIAGASSAPRVDSWPDSDPSQPLLARR